MYIITNKEKEIVNYIVNRIKRGATYINAHGAYTNIEQNMIMCVVSSREMMKIKRKLYTIDSTAICFIGEIREAFGEGFTKFKG